MPSLKMFPAVKVSLVLALKKEHTVTMNIEKLLMSPINPSVQVSDTACLYAL